MELLLFIFDFATKRILKGMGMAQFANYGEIVA